MNTTNLVAWLICLVLGFLAVILALLNRYEVILMREKQDTVESRLSPLEAAERHDEMWEEIRDLLRGIRDHMEQRPAQLPSSTPLTGGPADAAEEDPKPSEAAPQHRATPVSP